VTRSAGVTRPSASPADDPVDGRAATPRAVRKDAQRNRDALLIAAADAFAERGVECSLEEIARRAGVGIGTLYRHFPNRDALIEAVYRREVATLCDRVPDLLGKHQPIDALRMWLREFAGYVARKRGMAMALKSALGPDNELFTESHRRMHEAFDAVLRAAVDSGEVRPDANPDDLMRGLSGICMASDTTMQCAERNARLVDLLVDGLRYGASH
jgi:AcrR family transcriptional regulator